MNTHALLLIGLAALVWLAVALITPTRLSIALKLWRDRGLDYTWSRAWRKAGHHTRLQ